MTILTHLGIIRENLLDQLKKHTSVPHTKPGNPIMPSSFNLASNLLKFFHYEIFYYFSSLSTFMLFQHCTAPDSSCPFIQEWSMHTSFTGMCRDGLTNHFGMNTDAVCIALFLYRGINSHIFRFALCIPFSDEIKCPSPVQQSWFIFLWQNFYFNCQKSLCLHFSELLTQQDVPSEALIISTCLSPSKLAAVVLLYSTLVGYKSTEGRTVTARASADIWCPYGQYNLTLTPFFTEFDPGPMSQTLAVRGLVVSNGHLCFIIILNKHN